MENAPHQKHLISIDEPLRVFIEQKSSEVRASGFWKNNHFLDMVKWVGGTLVLGLIGIWINIMNVRNDQEIKKTDIDTKTIQDMNSKLALMPLETRQIYLQEMEHLMISKAGREYMEKKLENLTNDMQRLQTATNVLNKATDSASRAAGSAIPTSKRDALVRVNADRPAASGTAGNEVSIDTLTQRTDAILGNTGGHAPAEDSAIRQLEQARLLAAPKVSDEYVLAAPPETKWCKEGYYVEYNNTLRLGISDRQGSLIRFNLKDISGDRTAPEKINGGQAYSLWEGKSLTVTVNEFRYVISLDRVGSAGKNPFTKAAYITVTTYRK